MGVSVKISCTVEAAASAVGIHEEQAHIKPEEVDEDEPEPEPVPEPEPKEEEGGGEEGALDEESLPSTLFYGVRGQQARPHSPMQCCFLVGPPCTLLYNAHRS